MDEATIMARLVSRVSLPSVQVLPIHPSVRLDVLDAAAVLQVRRAEIAAQLQAGHPVDAQVIGVGLSAVNAWMGRESAAWRDVRSTRPQTAVEYLRLVLPLNRIRGEAGCRCSTLFDHAGIDANARLLVANEPVGSYRVGVAPTHMTMVDNRFVLLWGPSFGEEVSVMKVTAPTCLEAAHRYWEAASRSATPVDSGTPELGALTPRQRQIVALLSASQSDEAIAATVGVSVRTVRSDIAAVLEALGVRSRFAAGARLRLGPGTS